MIMAQGCMFVQRLKTVNQLIMGVDVWVCLYVFVKAYEPVGSLVSSFMLSTRVCLFVCVCVLRFLIVSYSSLGLRRIQWSPSGRC